MESSWLLPLKNFKLYLLKHSWVQVTYRPREMATIMLTEQNLWNLVSVKQFAYALMHS